MKGLVSFFYTTLPALSLEFDMPDSANMRVVSKITAESYCTAVHEALSSGRSRPLAKATSVSCCALVVIMPTDTIPMY